MKYHNVIQINIITKMKYIPCESLSATQKSWRGLGSDAMAPEAAKARRTVRRRKLEEAMSSNLGRSFLPSLWSCCLLVCVFVSIVSCDALSVQGSMHIYSS